MSFAASTPQPPSRLWSRNFILVSLTNLFQSLVFYLLVTAMALYAVNEFQASAVMSGLAYSGVLAFLNGYAREQGISPTSASLFFVVYAVVLVLSRFIVGPAHDRYGDNAVVFPLLACLAVAMAVLALWPAVPGLIIAAVLCAFGFGALLTSLQSVAATVVPPFQIGVATSTYFLMLDVGIGLGPILLGSLLPVTGFSGMYLGLAGFVLLTMGVYWLVHGRRAQHRPGRGEQ